MNKMADQLHYSIRDFRDILLGELTKLEFGAREHIVNNVAVHSSRTANVDNNSIEHERELKKLRKEIADLTEQVQHNEKNNATYTIVSKLESEVNSLNHQLKKLAHENAATHHTANTITVSFNNLKNDFDNLTELHKVLNVEYDTNRAYIFKLEEEKRILEKRNAELQVRLELEEEKLKALDEKIRKDIEEEKVQSTVINVIQQSEKTKTVTHPLLGKIEEPVIKKEEETVAQTEEDGESIDPSTLPSFKHKGVIYKRDPTDGTLYNETEEGWEIIGTWDETTKTILTETVEVAEEENELTEFVFKGKTYFLDEENTVFHETDEGYEQVGTWNGKKILFE